MPKCTPKTFKYRRICTGDLNRIIKLKDRTLDAPSTSVDYGHTFTDVSTWAAVETVKGKDIFAGTNMDQLVSHIFYIRYRELTSEDWLEYRSQNYDILDVENLEENNAFLALMCNVRGSTEQPVNEA